MSIAKMIKGHELFQSFGFEEVERISTFSGSKPYEKGDVIFSRGDHGSHFFVVIEGQVNLELPSADDESTLVVGKMGQGDIFGVSPLLGVDRYTTTAQCARPGTVLAVEVEPFRKLLDTNPTVGMNVMTVMARAYFSRYIETLRRFQNILNELALT